MRSREAYQAFIRGDINEALKFIYKKYLYIVRKRLDTVANSLEDYEDVMQRILISVYANKGLAFKGINQFDYWLNKTIKNHVMDNIRNLKYKKYTFKLTEEFYEDTVSNEDIESNFNAKLFVENLKHWIKPRELKLLKMKYMDGYEYSEIYSKIKPDTTEKNIRKYTLNLLRKVRALV